MFENNTKVFVYDDIATALKKVRKQIINHEKKLKWTGPDELHTSLSATSPEPSWHFSTEGLGYHRERGRDRWDVYTLICFQLGYHNGAASTEVTLGHQLKVSEERAELWKESYYKTKGVDINPDPTPAVDLRTRFKKPE